MRLVGAVLMVLVIGLVVRQYFPVFIDPMSGAFVLGGVAALLLMTQDKDTWKAFFQFVTLRGKLISDERKESLAEFLRTGSRGALAFGIFGQISGLVIMLFNLTDPSSIGPAMAISLITLVHGVVLSEMVFVPMHRTLTRTWARERRGSLPIAGLFLVMMSSLMSVGMFLVLMVSVD